MRKPKMQLRIIIIQFIMILRQRKFRKIQANIKKLNFRETKGCFYHNLSLSLEIIIISLIKPIAGD